MFGKIFWTDAAERAIKTVAQVVLSLLTIDATSTVLNADWKGIVAASLTAGLISILTSIVSATARERGTAGLVVNPPVPPKKDEV